MRPWHEATILLSVQDRWMTAACMPTEKGGVISVDIDVGKSLPSLP
ncbi:MAG: hypothetical protein QW587_04515 [Candidatus Bathyarchaeia archaeon]